MSAAIPGGITPRNRCAHPGACWKICTGNKKAKGSADASFCLAWESGYLASVVALGSSAFLRLSQLYFFWNFSTRPVVSTYFILPVKNGWHMEQISTEIFFLVLRVVNLLPQPHVTVASSYLGWMSFFMRCSGR